VLGAGGAGSTTPPAGESFAMIFWPTPSGIAARLVPFAEHGVERELRDVRRDRLDDFECLQQRLHNHVHEWNAVLADNVLRHFDGGVLRDRDSRRRRARVRCPEPL
jgi:hypothetical protein